MFPLSELVADPVSRRSVQWGWWLGCGLWRRRSEAGWPRHHPACSGYTSEPPVLGRCPPKPTVEKTRPSHQQGANVGEIIFNRIKSETSKMFSDMLLFPSMSTRLQYSWENFGWDPDTLIASHHKQTTQNQTSKKNTIKTEVSSRMVWVVINAPNSKCSMSLSEQVQKLEENDPPFPRVVIRMRNSLRYFY